MVGKHRSSGKSHRGWGAGVGLGGIEEVEPSSIGSFSMEQSASVLKHSMEVIQGSTRCKCMVAMSMVLGPFLLFYGQNYI